MVNDIIVFLIGLFNHLYVSLDVSTLFNNVLTYLSEFENHIVDIQFYLSGAYFVFGKSLVIFTLGAGTVVLLFRLVMALIYIIGQYVP